MSLVHVRILTVGNTAGNCQTFLFGECNVSLIIRT